ncbi:hypothetical protein F4782DRAFT_537852 [Xylaria castorea]|nr:hypothetical protein F4782DRAFT_537852 [Xylaria castorea]
MADPLSVASGALAVITATQKTASAIYKFIRDCKEARADLTRVTGELSELTLILELIRDDNSATKKGCLPNALQAQVQAMLSGCTTTVQQIEYTLAKCRGKPGPLRWTMFEKDRVKTLKGSLEAFKSGLNLALETVNLSITRGINNKTGMIQDNTLDIKRDTSEILSEIYKLRTQLPASYQSEREQFRLEQCLNSLTHYTGTVVADEELEDLFEVVSFLDDIEEKESDGETSHSKNAGEQGVSDNEVASQQWPYMIPSMKSIDTGDAETWVRRRGISLALGKDQFGNQSESESESSRQRSPRTRSPETRKLATTKHTQSGRGPGRISHNIIASIPCISNIVRLRYCMALDIWATLHEDLILRLWSLGKAELIVSLPVLRKDSGDPGVDMIKLNSPNIRMLFCPAKPELILIQVWRHKVEVWNWNKIRRISIASDAQTAFKEESIKWVNFVSQSTLVYALDGKGDLMVVDLDEPLVPRKISLAILTGRAQGDFELDENLHGHVFFVSCREIWILWKRSITRRDLARGIRSPWLAELIRLPSTNRQRVSVTTRYSDDVIKQARVTARYQLHRHMRSITSIDLDLGTRRLRFEAKRDKVRNKGERWPRTMYVLDLDTGTRLSELPLSGECWNFPPPFQYLFSWNPITDLTSVLRVKDGCDLGILEGRAYMTSSGKAGLVRQVASELQFGITIVNLDELGK